MADTAGDTAVGQSKLIKSNTDEGSSENQILNHQVEEDTGLEQANVDKGQKTVADLSSDIEESELQMDDEMETETLFQCQLCDYAGHSKEKIADHFISTHATIQVIQSPVKRSNRISRSVLTTSTKSPSAKGKPEPVTPTKAAQTKKVINKSPAKGEPELKFSLVKQGPVSLWS